MGQKTHWTEDSLIFITSSGPKVQDDSKVRSMIRKQAMKNTALERKRRGSVKRVNVGQLPTVNNTDDIVYEATDAVTAMAIPDQRPICVGTNNRTRELTGTHPWRTRKIRGIQGHKFQLCLGVPRNALQSGYEAARRKFQVDVMDLAMLTSFSVGAGTKAALAADPARLLTLLGHVNWSYLQFVPAYYGGNDCLTKATDCLLASLRSILMPHKKNASLETQLYVEALKSLQHALEDASTCTNAEVLCASQLLSLHELLSPVPDTAWSRHMKGSVRLIKHKGPGCFKSDFEKALFAAHVGPICFEAIVRHDHCYLEEPEWIQLYQSMTQISDHLTDRSPLAVSIRAQLFVLPGLWHDMDGAMRDATIFDFSTARPLELRCIQAHQTLEDWMRDYKAYCLRSPTTPVLSQEFSIRRKLVGIAIECLIVVKRLLATFCDEQRVNLERDVQVFAQLLSDLQKQPSAPYSWLFFGHEIGIIQSVMLTKDQWMENISYTSEAARRNAVCVRYNTWTSILQPDM